MSELKLKKYEIMLVLSSELTEAEKEEKMKEIRSLLESNKKIEAEEFLGLKDLAYRIKKNNTGYYYLIHFWQDPEKIREIEKEFRIDTGILRQMIMAVPDDEELIIYNEEDFESQKDKKEKKDVKEKKEEPKKGEKVVVEAPKEEESEEEEVKEEEVEEETAEEEAEEEVREESKEEAEEDKEETEEEKTEEEAEEVVKEEESEAEKEKTVQEAKAELDEVEEKLNKIIDGSDINF